MMMMMKTLWIAGGRNVRSSMLHVWEVIDINSMTELDIMMDLFGLVFSCCDDSVINAHQLEKSSVASSASKNQIAAAQWCGRTRTIYLIGSKVDGLYYRGHK
ncbi:unnamed protein product [Absidia cylindrospora]